ncbi:MAG: hypothetical protein K1X67_08495 [Fimbriimonadaceae bacterium]|nr:hypothetical protein [Fimbriimonadaceae bacterium]
MVLMHRALCVLTLVVLCGAALANETYSDDVPLEEYLRALGAIAPAARDGAEAYLRAYRANCGREMKSGQLRRAVADGSGDPVLMGMVRAKHYKDEADLRSLSKQVGCGR